MTYQQYRDALLPFGFELLEPIDRGAYGEVWKARQLLHRDPGLGCQRNAPPQPEKPLVAIKIIDEVAKLDHITADPGLGNDSSARSVFLMEYRAFIRREFANCTKLRGNPHIVTVISSGSFPSPTQPSVCECHFIAMELMQCTLRTKMREGSLTITDRVRLGLDAVRATQYAHTQDVAHRDIKPENLLIANAPHVAIKMGDFGISVDYGVPTDRRSGTKWAGTVPYTAPEIFSVANVSGRSISADQFRHIVHSLKWNNADVFSLGVTLYELFMGTLPYSLDLSLDARIAVLQNQTYRRPTEQQHIPWAVGEILERMIRPKASERPDLALVCERFEGAVGQCLAENSKEKLSLGLDYSVTRMVRGSLRKKIDSVVRQLAPSLSPPPNHSEDHADWYMNVLLRPTERPNDAQAVMSRHLCPVYGAHFVGDELRHCDHWDQSRDLVTRTVSISDSCCGIPILWLEDPSELIAGGMMNSGRVDVRLYDNRPDVVSFVLITHVFEERFGDPPNPVVSQIYKTDQDCVHSELGALRGNGWVYRPVPDGVGPVHRMKQNIETELVVPIYGPSRRRHHRSPDDICGILNIEWTWPIDEPGLARIEKFVVDAIHRDKLFPISEFLSEIVSIVTTLRY